MNFAVAAAGATVTTAAAAAAAGGAAEHRKLTDAAQQFEGMLLQEMLKPMKEHGFCDGDEDGSGGSGDQNGGFADTLSTYGTEAMATAIAKDGGLGIARRVVAQVEGEKAAHTRVRSAGVEFQNNTVAVLKS